MKILTAIDTWYGRRRYRKALSILDINHEQFLFMIDLAKQRVGELQAIKKEEERKLRTVEER